MEPLTETSELEYDSGLKSYVAIKNTGYTTDNGTRVYIVPKAHVSTGVGGCLKIFADNYPNAANYRDVGIYYAADQNSQTGGNNCGVFWINTKNEGFNTNADIGFCFQDGAREIMRMIDGPHTPFVYVGTGTPTYENSQGTIYYKMQVDGNFLVENPYRIFIGTGNSFFEDANGNYSESCMTKKTTYVGGNELFVMEPNGMTAKKNITMDSGYGLILKSPNGHKWKASIADNGTLSWTDIGA